MDDEKSKKKSVEQELGTGGYTQIGSRYAPCKAGESPDKQKAVYIKPGQDLPQLPSGYERWVHLVE